MTDDDFRYGKSPLTGNWYKITEWEEVEEPEGETQKIVAKQKEPVDESEVPEEAKQVIPNDE